MKSNALPAGLSVLLPALIWAVLAAAGCSSGKEAPTSEDVAPTPPEAYRVLKQEALALRNDGDLPGAIQKISRALALLPDEREPYRIASGFYMDMVNDEEAIRFFDITTRMTPSSSWPWYYRGFHQFRAGQWNDALDSFKEASSLDPGNAEFHFRQGLVLQAAGEFDPALAELRSAMDLDRSSAVIAARLIRLLRITGDLGGADQVLKEVLSRTSMTADLAFAMGQIRSSQNRLDEAERAYRDAIRLDPSHMEAHQNLARLLQAAGRTEEAKAEAAIAGRLRDFRDGIESWTAEAAGSRDPLPALSIAELYLTEGRIDQALTWFARAGRLGGPEDRIRAGRAEALFAKGDMDGGDRELADLRSTSGGRVALARAVRFLSAGDTAEAKKLLDKALQHGPGDREFLRRVSDLLAAGGEAERSAAVLDQAAKAKRVHGDPAKEGSK